MSDASRHLVTIEDSAAGERLDRALTAALPDLTRSRVKALIESRRVTLADGPTVEEPSRKVKKGEQFVITFEGQITENAVMLMPTSGDGYKFTCTHNAAAKTLVGASSLGSASASFTFRLAPQEVAK